MKVTTSGRRMVSKERRYLESGTEKETKTIRNRPSWPGTSKGNLFFLKIKMNYSISNGYFGL